MRQIITILMLTLMLNSCKKETINLNEFWQCNKSQNLDTTTISSKLFGLWKWSKQVCGDGGGKTKSADKNINVTFRADRSFSVNENATLLTQGTWKLVQVNLSSWGLELSSKSEYLYGRILFCYDQVLFNDSYRDGCDNLFIKNK